MSHKLTMLFDGDDSLFKDVLKTSKIFGEYGCGSSTEWVLKNTNADIVSVDSSKVWVDKISSGNAAYKKRLKLKYMEPRYFTRHCFNRWKISSLLFLDIYKIC